MTEEEARLAFAKTKADVLARCKDRDNPSYSWTNQLKTGGLVKTMVTPVPVLVPLYVMGDALMLASRRSWPRPVIAGRLRRIA